MARRKCCEAIRPDERQRRTDNLVVDQIRRSLDKLIKKLQGNDFFPEWEKLTVADVDYLNNMSSSIQIKRSLVLQAIKTGRSCEEIFDSEVEEPDHSWA